MTRKRLEQYRYMVRESEILKKDIDSGNLFESYKSELVQIYQDRLARLHKELICVEEFIDKINDSQMRMIISLRFIKGKTWLQTAVAIGEYDEQYPRKKFNSFLKKYNFDEKNEI